MVRGGWLMLGLAACGGAEVDEVQWVNQGRVCLSSVRPVETGSAPAGSPTTPTTPGLTADTAVSPVVVVASGDTLQAEVTFGGCDCGDASTASCTATRDGDAWTITSEATSLSSCDVCEPLVATCSLGVPADGSHTVAHGGDRLVLEVPGELDPSCMGAPVAGELL